MGKPFADKYDFQFILYFAGGADKVPESNAENIVIRAAEQGVLAKTRIIPLREIGRSATYNLSEYKALAKGRVHVYVVGHGTDTSDRVGDCTAADMAKTLDTISEGKLTRVSFVACHAGGDGNTAAPHRFVKDFWDLAKGFVEEVSGYTGTVHGERSRYAAGDISKLPDDAIAYRSWSGEDWWVVKGTAKKVVGRQHAEGGNVRKIYYSSKGGFSKGWSPAHL